jgi:hypothetical protein
MPPGTEFLLRNNTRENLDNLKILKTTYLLKRNIGWRAVLVRKAGKWKEIHNQATKSIDDEWEH